MHCNTRSLGKKLFLLYFNLCEKPAGYHSNLRRRDLDISHDGIGSCCVEIIRERQKNVLVGCVYRHPKGNLEFFRETLRKQLEQLNTKGHEDFFKYNDDKQTSEYMDMLLPE